MHTYTPAACKVFGFLGLFGLVWASHCNALQASSRRHCKRHQEAHLASLGASSWPSWASSWPSWASSSPSWPSSLPSWRLLLAILSLTLALLRLLWAVLGLLLAILSLILAILGLLLAVLGPPLASLGPPLGHLGGSFWPFWASSWPPWASCWPSSPQDACTNVYIYIYLYMSNVTGICPRWHSSSPAQASFTFLPFAAISSFRLKPQRPFTHITVSASLPQASFKVGVQSLSKTSSLAPGVRQLRPVI